MVSPENAWLNHRMSETNNGVDRAVIQRHAVGPVSLSIS
jgi:hypothetical protein